MTQKVRAVGVRNGRAVWFGEGRVLASALEWLGGYGALARPRGLCLGDVLGKVSKHILASGRCGRTQVPPGAGPGMTAGRGIVPSGTGAHVSHVQGQWPCRAGQRVTSTTDPSTHGKPGLCSRTPVGHGHLTSGSLHVPTCTLGMLTEHDPGQKRRMRSRSPARGMPSVTVCFISWFSSRHRGHPRRPGGRGRSAGSC